MRRAFDFDDTVYDGDSTLDFHRYCLKRDVRLLRYFPYQLFHYILFRLKLEDSTVFKSNFFSYLRGIPEVVTWVEDFWSVAAHSIKPWYTEQKHSQDCIVTASPEFLVKPIMQQLGIGTVIATKMDPSTGLIQGRNCYGIEKIRRLHEALGEVRFDEAYSDHMSDGPLFNVALQAYVVKGDRIISLQAYRRLSWIQRKLL